MFTLSLKRDQSDDRGIGITIPTDLYLDRYTQEFAPLVKGMRLQKEALDLEIAALQKREDRLTAFSKMSLAAEVGEGKKAVAPEKLLETAIQHIGRLALRMRKPVVRDGEDDVAMQERPEIKKLGAQLRALLGKLTVRLEGKRTPLSPPFTS